MGADCCKSNQDSRRQIKSYGADCCRIAAVSPGLREGASEAGMDIAASKVGGKSAVGEDG